MNAASITYLRAGRQTRATGIVIETDPSRKITKVKPKRKEWGMIWITAKEIEAGPHRGRNQPPRLVRVWRG